MELLSRQSLAVSQYVSFTVVAKIRPQVHKSSRVSYAGKRSDVGTSVTDAGVIFKLQPRFALVTFAFLEFWEYNNQNAKITFCVEDSAYRFHNKWRPGLYPQLLLKSILQSSLLLTSDLEKEQGSEG